MMQNKFSWTLWHLSPTLCQQITSFPNLAENVKYYLTAWLANLFARQQQCRMEDSSTVIQAIWQSVLLGKGTNIGCSDSKG